MKKKTLSEWLSFIEQSHSKDIDMGLGRSLEVLDRLKLNFASSRIVSVAGTNGKGSSSKIISRIASSASLSVGVYASPHLLRFNERININGQDIDDASLCAAFETVEHARQQTPLTYFEFATLAALVCFADATLDVIVLEVGLGGRLDATNIIDADVAVITSIGLDHQDWLGNTLDEIAVEKYGIIKSGAAKDKSGAAKTSKAVIGFSPSKENIVFPSSDLTDVWILERDFPTYEFVENKSGHRHFKFVFPGHSNIAQGHNKSQFPIEYCWHNQQLVAQNIVTAIMASWRLTEVLDAPKRLALQKLLSSADKLEALIDKLQMNGRYQVLLEKPMVIADVAHNEHAALYLKHHLQLKAREHIEAIKGDSKATLHLVVAMLKDKNIEATLSVFKDANAHWYLADSSGSRGESAQRLLAVVEQMHYASGQSFASVEKALNSALEHSAPTDIICVFGSFFTVGEAIEITKQMRQEQLITGSNK